MCHILIIYHANKYILLRYHVKNGFIYVSIEAYIYKKQITNTPLILVTALDAIGFQFLFQRFNFQYPQLDSLFPFYYGSYRRQGYFRFS